MGLIHRKRDPFFDTLDVPQRIVGGLYRIDPDTPYAQYLKHLQPVAMDAKLREARALALSGALEECDYARLNTLFEAQMASLQEDSYQHFANLNRLALLLGQILFVNNGISEGLDRVAPGFRKEQLDLALRLQSQSQPSSADTCAFNAAVFVLQTAFDRIFVPPSRVGAYRVASGEYVRSGGYAESIRYLELSAIREDEAERGERTLCYNLTTGWGAGIRRETWDRLNRDYYAGISPTTGRTNLFAGRYNDLLERMLPQFSYAKVRLADSIVAQLSPQRNYQIVEIGAGSGAFAIDLLMACRRYRFPSDRLSYLGVEPSPAMISSFLPNLKERLGIQRAPDRFRLEPGCLETLEQNLTGQSSQVENIAVLCFSAHHIYRPSLEAWLTSKKTRDFFSRILILDGTERHGWSKMYYMWADCESPESFDNVALTGDWSSTTLWEEPDDPVAATAGRQTNAWCRARLLTKA